MFKLVVFPYDLDNRDIVINVSDSKKFQICDIVSPQGWGFKGQNVVINDVEIQIKSEIVMVSEECDAIWIMDSYYQLDFEDIVPILEVSKKKKWKVYWGRNCTSSEKETLCSIVPRESLVILENENFKFETTDRVYALNTPIVFLLDCFGDMFSSNVSILLSQAFEKIGYTTRCLSKRCDMGMTGKYDVLPMSAMDKKASNKERVIKLNNFLKEFEEEYKPDLIIIEVPGNVLEMSNAVHGDFGCAAYIFSKAIPPDGIIVNIPYSDNIVEYYKNLGEEIQKIVGVEVDFYNIVPKYLDINESEQRAKFEYVRLSEEFMKKNEMHRNDLNTILNEEDAIYIAKQMVEKLKTYAAVDIV